jgi:chlorophyll(ide) b reductase
MILTDLLLEGASVASKQAFNILCEQPETAAAFLAPRIRTVVARNQRDAYVK